MTKHNESVKSTKGFAAHGGKREIVLILPDIRSAHNVGSIFRTADAAGVSRVYLCGHSPLPIDRFERVQKEIAKTALGAEKTIAWEYVADPKDVIRKISKDGFQIISLEQSDRSKHYRSIEIKSKCALVVGNEVEGISKDVLDMSDEIIEIPMSGKKESLNVAVSFGIALFGMLNI